MEAVPKIPMMMFELKTSPEKTHFGPKLKQYISEAYGENPDDYNNEMHQLENLRAIAVRPTNDSTGLNNLTKYFCQLRTMQSRFPMARGQPASVSFVWKDLYANVNCTSQDIRFEMACILYNIGSLHTQLGASEPRTNADSLKAACTHYQRAAWAFQCLRENYPQPSGVDVSPEIMRLLQEISLAQAQECILDKSIQDTKKPSVVGAVATQVMHFYRNCLTILGPSTGSDNIHEVIGTKLYNYWYRYLSFKLSFTGCLVALYQGLNVEEQQKMGERVAFYNLALERLNEAKKLAKYIEPVKVTQEALIFTNDVVEGKRKAAKNENEFIYHEDVPNKDMLTELKAVCLVKGISIDFDQPEVSGPDIFSRLIPMDAHESSSMYSEEKAKLLRQIVNKAEAKSTELLEFMSSLQLDQLDVVDSEQSSRIPQDIVDRCAAMNAKTEVIQSLVDSMNSLAEIISDVESSLAECKDMIQEEAAKEKEYQKVMGPRPPSIVQTELSREFSKYQEAHSRTNESNQVLHKAMTLHIANLRLLAQPLDQLQAKIPSVNNIEGLDREAMSEMRRVVGKARQMQAQRDSVIQELRSDLTEDDITGVLLQKPECVSVGELFEKELKKHTPKVKIVEQNLAAQENIINKLTSLYASYGESRRLLSDVLRKREALINALITSYDSYEELQTKCQKGLEFYKKLSHNVNQLLSRLRSTCQVNHEERDQLLAKQSEKGASAAATPMTSSRRESTPPPVVSEGYAPKLKDYLPYMKSRGFCKSVPTPAQPSSIPTDTYYPEAGYPTSVRPPPLGSEAPTDPQVRFQDGYNAPHPNNPYTNPYAPADYTVPNQFTPNKSYPFEVKPDNEYAYSSPYTPPQYSSNYHMSGQIYNPYYTGNQDSLTTVTDSQIPQNAGTPVGQPQFYGSYPYAQSPSFPGHTQPQQPPDSQNKPDLSSNFAQMQINQEPKFDQNQSIDYSKMYYGQYQDSPGQQNIPQANTPTDYVNPYGSMDQTVPNQAYTPAVPDMYAYPSTSTAQGNNFNNPNMMYNPAIGVGTHDMMQPGVAAVPNLDAIDKPIKSHARKEALSSSYYSNSSTHTMPDQSVPPSGPTNPYSTQANVNYVQVYQNPTYTYNPSTGNYDISYSQVPSQYSINSQPESVLQNVNTNPEMAQSPSDTPQVVPSPGQSQQYYNSPYGYITNMQQPDLTANLQQVPTNYGANVNQSTYMQSGPMQNTSVTYTNNQVPTPLEHEPEQTSFNQNTSNDINTQQSYQSVPNYQHSHDASQNMQTEFQNYQNQTDNSQSVPVIYQSVPPESYTQTYQNSSGDQIPPQAVENYKVESEISNTQYVNIQTHDQNSQDNSENIPNETNDKQINQVEIEKSNISAFDLLSDIDFTVEAAPLKPEIKVPQISEYAIKKPVLTPKVEPKVIKEEKVIYRPPKRDIFLDPLLLNKFTEEVKSFQKLVDSLCTKKVAGVSLLDHKWKSLQDLQLQVNMTKSKTVVMENTSGNILTAATPYDETRLTLNDHRDAYINATYYEQLTPWCVPLVLSDIPTESQYSIFWKAAIEYDIKCIVCLMTEIEMQGQCYWPTALGQQLDFDYDLKVKLDNVKTTVHWIERKIIVTYGNNVSEVTHYQINVFPAKIVCAPLVMLAERLTTTAGAGWVQCTAGGRGAVLAATAAALAAVRGGEVALADLVDSILKKLYERRANVLEDTKYLADIYRIVLYYAQGVICSGTTSFNGETIAITANAATLPPLERPKEKDFNKKFSKESFEEMRQSPGLKIGDMKDPLNFLDPLWSLKKK